MIQEGAVSISANYYVLYVIAFCSVTFGTKKKFARVSLDQF